MKKKILSLLLAAVLCVGLMPGAKAAYSDVPSDHWAAVSIERATELGIFNGIGNGQFGFGQKISRASFVTALVRLFGWKTVAPDRATFTDVKKGEWYYSAVETAAANGALPVSSQNFRPSDSLSRGEMAAMLMRALGYTSLASAVSKFECPFSDVTTNKGFIILAYDMGIVAGRGDGTFAPNEAATREQAATLLVRLHDRLHQESTALASATGWTQLRVKSPEAVQGAEMPTTPLEPIIELYQQLRSIKNSGLGTGRVALVLRAGGIRTIVSNEGEIISSEPIDRAELDRIFANNSVRTYYSQRYESAYGVYQPNYYQTVTVWYQSEESLAVKLQLARMFGVTHYVLE